MLFTHDSQHYCFLGQANLYQLHGHWQMTKQIRNSLFAKEDSNFLDAKLNVFKKDDNKDFGLVKKLLLEEAESGFQPYNSS